jgi:Holliday junction DNA helicase RuvB
MVDSTTAEKAMAMLEIDELGLDPSDRRVLDAIIDNHKGGPVGVNTLAALTGDEQATIEDFFEPYLMQIGLIERTPRGRKATQRAYKHLDKKRPGEKSDQTELV